MMKPVLAGSCLLNLCAPFTPLLDIHCTAGGKVPHPPQSSGIFLPEDHAFAGPAAEAFLDNVRADLVFFSSQGLSSDGEISDASEVQTALRRVMLRRAERKYFLCDASKFGVQRLFTLCRRDALTDILSDAPLPWESAENFAEKT